MITQDLGIATAYGYAKSKGYTGTEAEFAELMASYASTAQTAIEAADRAVEANTAAQSAKTDAAASKTAAQTAAQTATTKASEASQSASTATTKASEASTSASTASAAATSASTSAQTATAKAGTATAKADEAAASATTASTAKTDAESARDAAAQSASEAAESARTLTIDPTLTQSGQAADAKVVGDEIDSFGTKLFDYTNVLKFISSGFSRNGLNVTMSDNVITLDGSTSDSITIDSGLFDAPKLKPSTTYTFRILNADRLNNSCSMYLRNTSGNIVSFPWGAGGQSGITFTTPSNIDDVFWRLYIGGNTTFSNASGCFMVVEGSTPPTTFVPHKDPLFATSEAVKDVNDNVILNASNITELNSFIRNAITSNIIFKESEIIVSGTSDYVYSYINVPVDNTSGDINVSIKAVNGNTAAKPAMMRLINKDGTTTSWEWITQTANKTFHHSVSPTGETEKVSIRLYPAQGTVLPSGEAIYNDLIVYCDKPDAHVYDDMYFPVPEYYSTHIKEKITTINAYMAQFSAVGDAFIFVTDQHWNFNQQNSLSLIQKIAKDTFVPMLISGGDVRDFGSSDYCKKLKLAFPYEIHHIAGNHDYFWEDGINVGSKLYSYFDTYADNQVYGNAERHYYYVDNHQKKLRYIFLSAYDVGSSASSLIVNGYEQEQLTWFTNVALDLSDGWEAIVFTHALYSISLATDEYQLIPGASDFVNAIDASGKIIAVFQGHTHRDRVIYTPGEVPVIVTTCDKNIPWNDGTYDDLNVDRTSRTINEQAFDVVLIDRANRIIHVVRVGAQALNGIGNTAGSAVAERTIEY